MLPCRAPRSIGASIHSKSPEAAAATGQPPLTTTRSSCSLALDQGFFGPASIGIFFVGSGLLEGKSKEQVQEKLRDRWWSTVKVGWTLWVPFSFVTFRFIPMHYRLAAGQAVAIGWNCFMSYANAHSRHRGMHTVPRDSSELVREREVRSNS